MNTKCGIVFVAVLLLTATESQECFKDIIEVIFVVDGSESIGLENFQFVKQWLVNMTKALIDRYQGSVRTEVLQYSDQDSYFSGVKIEDSNLFVIPYTLNDKLSIEEMEERINNMPYLKDKTYTYYALRRVMEVEFPNSEYYANSTKIVIVLTDGTANDAVFLKDPWYNTYKNSMTSFSVGVAVEGKTNFLTQLRNIANGGASDDRVLSVKNFDDLHSIVNDLTTGINNAANQTDLAPCPTILPSTEVPSADPVDQTSGVIVTIGPVDQTSGVTMTTGDVDQISGATVASECFNGVIEVIFVVDGSESIGLENFQLVKQWLVSITKSLIDRYRGSMRTQILQYSDQDSYFSGVRIEDSKLFVIPYVLNDKYSIEEMEEKINNMTYLKSRTYTYYALRRVMEVEFPNSECYMNSTKIVVVLTDGTANDAPFLMDWYNTYEDEVTPFAVGVAVEGKTNFLTQLRNIANGGTSDDRVLSIRNFDDFQSIVNNLTMGINNAANQTDLAPYLTTLPMTEAPSTSPVEQTSNVPVTTGPVDQTPGHMMTTAGPLDQTLVVTVTTDTVDQTTHATTTTSVVEPSAMCPNASSNCDLADAWLCEHFYQKKILSEWMEKYLMWWRSCPSFAQRNWDQWASSTGLKQGSVENYGESQQGAMDGYGEMGFIRMMKANIQCYNYSSMDCHAGETFYDILGCKHCYHRGLKGRNTQGLSKMWKQGFLQHKTLMKIYNVLRQECSGSSVGCAEEISSVPEDETTSARVHPTYSPP